MALRAAVKDLEHFRGKPNRPLPHPTTQYGRDTWGGWGGSGLEPRKPDQEML